MKNNLKFLFFYFLLSVIFTYPLIFNLKNMLIGWPLDAYNYIWNIDTFIKSLFDLKNPFFTNKIFYPLGTNLIFHTYAPLISIVSIPFFKNTVPFFNLLVILSPVFSSYFSYSLIKDITKDNRSSFMGGFVYGFSPILFSFIVSQHYYFAFAAIFLPLGLKSLVRYIKGDGVKNILYLIACFWGTILIDYYSSIIFVFVILIFLFFQFVMDCKKLISFFKRDLTKIFFISTVFFIIPFAAILLATKNENRSFLREKSYYPAICSAKLSRFIVPSEFNPLLNKTSLSIKQKFNIQDDFDTPSLFLGITVLLVALYGLFKNPKGVFPIFAFGFFILVYSLGPQTKLFNFITNLPFLGLIDCPQRFVIGTQLALSAMVGLSLYALNKSKYGEIIFLLICVLMFVEYLSFNLPNSKIEFPSIYQTLSQDRSNKTLLELPSGIAESKGAFGYDWSIQGLLTKQMYWQTIHNKPRIGGYTSRLDKTFYEYFKNESIISDLFEMTSLNGKWNGAVYKESEVKQFIEKFNLGFIVISPNNRQQMFINVVENVFKNHIEEKISKDGYLLYRIR